MAGRDGQIRIFGRVCVARATTKTQCETADERLTMMLSTVLVSGKLSWRLPFILSTVAATVLAALILLLATFPKAGRRLRPSPGGDAAVPFREKLRALYFSPVAMLLLVSLLLVNFAFNATASWAPTVATFLFEERSKLEVQVTLGAIASVAIPLAVLVTGLVMQGIRSIAIGVRVSFAPIGLAVLPAFLLALTADFYLFCACVALFSGCCFYLIVFFKSIPLLLEYSTEVALFALTQFVLALKIGGDVVQVRPPTLVLPEAPRAGDFSFFFWLRCSCFSSAMRRSLSLSSLSLLHSSIFHFQRGAASDRRCPWRPRCCTASDL